MGRLWPGRPYPPDVWNLQKQSQRVFIQGLADDRSRRPPNTWGLVVVCSSCAFFMIFFFLLMSTAYTNNRAELLYKSKVNVGNKVCQGGFSNHLSIDGGEKPQTW